MSKKKGVEAGAPLQGNMIIKIISPTEQIPNYTTAQFDTIKYI